MKYYTKTFLKAFVQQVDRNRNSATSKITLTMPSLDAEQMLDIAGAVREECSRRYSDLHLNIKMAEEMTAEWSEHQRDEARSYGWLEEGRSLTSYRNETPNERHSVLLLCGIDKIQDQGSLSDFLCLDTDYLMDKIIGKNFKAWEKFILQQAALDDTGGDALCHILLLVNDLPGAGLIALSNWLDNLQLKDCSSLVEIRGRMLSGLSIFNMPRFTSYEGQIKKSKKLSEYFACARDLFIFNNISSTRRKSYSEALSRANEKIQNGELEIDPAYLGSFGSAEELIDALQSYIGDRDYGMKSKLLSCDFPVVYEKLLTGKKTTKPKDSISKLSGYPVNAILSAVWKLFQAFCKERAWQEKEVLSSISITGISYKYGYEDNIAGSAADVADLAKEDLNRLIGGIDEVITSRLHVPGLEDLDVSCNIFKEIECHAKKKAASELQFRIQLAGSCNTICKQDFIWKINASDDYRLAIELIEQCVREMPESGRYLPFFHLRYYEELLASSSEEDSREILRHCLAETNGARTVNMCQGLQSSGSPDPLLPYMIRLGNIYRKFMQKVATEGLLRVFYAEGQDLWRELQDTYASTCDKAAEMHMEESSNFCFMMMRAFLITQDIHSEKREVWDECESSGIVTILHPTLLEMFDAQMIYLFAGFGAACAKALQLPPKNFPKLLWERYISLASIHAPIQALKKELNGDIAVDCRGTGLIHKIGQAEVSTDNLLSTRVSLDPVEVADEVKSSELFAASNDSEMIFHVLKNYYRTHPHAWDGIHLAFFRSTDIQPVISAIHHYLQWLAEDEHYDKSDQDKFLNRGSSYQLRIDFYTDKRDEADIAGYIAQWNEVWQEKISSDPRSPYSRTRKVISHKILPVKQGHDANIKVLKDIGFNANIAFFSDVTLYGKNFAHFIYNTSSLPPLHSLRFPILEKKECSITIQQTRRSRTISHKQFRLSTHFSNMVGTFCQRDQRNNFIRSEIDLSDWIRLIGFIHDCTDWVVCVDPNIDRRLLMSTTDHRDIISFGSGVGKYGEANYTVSTQQSDAKDLIRSLTSSLGGLFPSQAWNEHKRSVMAEKIYQASANLTGLSLVRAASHQDMHIHDFIAHSLTYRFIKPNDNSLCNILVSLDDYPHWFQFSESKKRPDLLWLTADKRPDGTLNLHARLIECKLCAANHRELEDAQIQIKEGYEKLSPLFVPGSKAGLLDDSQPDRRYWWMQLHRIISSSIEAENRQKVSEVTMYLENLAEGNFSIDFGGAIFAFWTDRDDSPAPLCLTRWNIAENVRGVLYTFGGKSIEALMSEDSYNASRTWDQLLIDSEAASFELPEYGYEEDEPQSCNEAETDDDLEEDEDEEGWKVYSPALLTTSDFTNDSISLQDQEDENIEIEPIEREKHTVGLSAEAEPEDAIEHDRNPEFSVEGNSKDIGDDTSTPPNNTAQTKLFDLSKIRVYLGNTSSGKKVYWEFGHPGLNNRHILLFGSSGCGKTYAMQCILSELAHAGAHNLIFDYTQSFTTREIKEGAEQFFPEEAQHYVVEEPLPLNPFQPQRFPLGSKFRNEDPMDLASRVGAIFRKVYGLGTQQAGELEKAIYAGIEAKGENFTFKELYEVLLAKTEEKGSSTIETLLNRIQKILLKAPFSTEGKLSWDDIFNSEIHNKIFQFQAIDDYTAKAVIEFLLWDLYAFVQRNEGNDKKPKVVVLDEIQNLDLDQNAPTAKYVTEGRKFGLALMGATQTLKGIGGASSYTSATLLQATQMLVFQPSSTELADFAKFLHDKDGNYSVQEWKSRLGSLNKGECYFVGPELNETTGSLRQTVRKIKIASFQERDFS